MPGPCDLVHRVLCEILAYFCDQKLLTAKELKVNREGRRENSSVPSRRPVSTLVHCVFHRLPRTNCALQSKQMQDRTETLTIGSRAPEFLLPAANRDGILSLSGFLARGALIVEFLRGTW